MLTDQCIFCKRLVTRTSEHHLIPQMKIGSRKNRRRLKEGEIEDKTVTACLPCHGHVHTLFTEKELEIEYNTVEKIMQHPDMAKFVKWVSNKPDGIKVPIKRPSRKRH